MGAMAVAIGYALFSLVPVGLATNQLGGADGAAPPGSVSHLRFRRFLFPDV